MYSSKNKRGYERELSIINNIKTKNKLIKLNSQSEFLHNCDQSQIILQMQQQLPLNDQLSCADLNPSIYSKLQLSNKIKRKQKIQYLKKMIIKMKAKELRKRFIGRILNNSKSFKRGKYKEDVIEKRKQRQNKISIQGIYIHNFIKVFISIINIISIIFTLFIASFQIFFQQFRSISSTNTAIITFKAIFLFFVAFKFIGGFIIQTISNGKRNIIIEDISIQFIKSVKCYLLLMHLLSLILLLSRPENIQVGIFGLCSSFINMLFLNHVQQIVYITFFQQKLKRQYYELFKLIIRNFFVIHIFAVMMLAIIQYDSNINWMTKYGIAKSYWLSQYWYACYWSATIVSTVGFGDITVANDKEAIIAIIIMIIGSLNISYNINKIGTIISSITQINDEVQNKLSLLRKIARSTGISEGLNHQIAEYVQHTGQIKKNLDVNERKDFIEMLPPHMKEQFLEQSSNNFFRNIPFFYSASIQTKIKIAQKLKQQIFTPHQYLTHKIDGLKDVKIMKQGKIGFAFKKKGSSLNGTILKQITITSPLLLNKYLLFRQKTINYHIISKTYSVAATMQIQQLRNCLRQSQLDNQVFQQIYDSAIVPEYQSDEPECPYCSSRHTIFTCPRLQYRPFASIVIMKNQNLKTIQTRKKIKIERNKIKSNKSPWILWNVLFKDFQIAFHIKSISKMARNMQKNDQKQRKQDSENNQQIELANSNQFNVDMLHNFRHYFKKLNSKFLYQQSLKKRRRITAQKTLRKANENNNTSQKKFKTQIIQCESYQQQNTNQQRFQ